MVFNKKRSDDRKAWLSEYNRGSFLDTKETAVSYKDFINKELIHFSKYDCDRSIPNLMDGLKISLRKILFAAFKKNLKTEIKVAQFSGYVSEHSGYHHGEASLNGAIVNMAQNYVGSNNINLFAPNGQFGTRLANGKDSASERYIFTQLNPLTRYIYPEIDDKILKYLDDDGTPVEPIYYAPIIPMILVNGSKGIGTGFSTDIMSYNPIQIISYIQHKLKSKTLGDTFEIEPYYEGFKGKIIKLNDSKYLIKGLYTILSANSIQITELPIGTATDDFKQFLEGMIDSKDTKKDKMGKTKTNILAGIIRDYNDMSTDTLVDIQVTFGNGVLNDLISKQVDDNINELEKTLKLCTTMSTSNMHMFDANEMLKKYDKVEEIIEDYYIFRYSLYKTRKEFQLKELEEELVVLSNKARYIQETLDDKIDLRKKSKVEDYNNA